jgi:hypothetical protein
MAGMHNLRKPGNANDQFRRALQNAWKLFDCTIPKNAWKLFDCTIPKNAWKLDCTINAGKTAYKCTSRLSQWSQSHWKLRHEAGCLRKLRH